MARTSLLSHRILSIAALLAVASLITGMAKAETAEAGDSGTVVPTDETDAAQPIVRLRTLWYENGEKQLEGTLVDDQRDGTWTWWYDNGQKAAVMEYDAGTAVGTERHWTPDGELVGEGEFRDGVEWTGTFIDFDAELKPTALRSLKDGQPHGAYLWWHKNGTLNTKGQFVEGRRDGVWSWSYEDGQEFADVTFQRDELTGTEHHWDPDGTLLTTGDYRDGQPWNGTFVDFDGTKLLITFQRSFKEGQPDGGWIWRYADGTPNTHGSFINGQKHGSWMWWYENGQKFAETEYNNGTSLGSLRHWSQDGELLTEGEYALDGREWNGTFVDFSSDMAMTAQRSFVDGRKEGTWIEWHENGAKAFEASYKNGRPEGIWTRWDENGAKTSEERYLSAVTPTPSLSSQ